MATSKTSKTFKAQTNYAKIDDDFLKGAYDKALTSGNATQECISYLASAGPALWSVPANAKAISLKLRLAFMVAEGNTLDYCSKLCATAKASRTTMQAQLFGRASSRLNYIRGATGLAPAKKRGTKAQLAANKVERKAKQIEALVKELPAKSIPLDSDAINVGAFRLSPIESAERLAVLALRAADEMSQTRKHTPIVAILRSFREQINNACAAEKKELAAQAKASASK